MCPITPSREVRVSGGSFLEDKGPQASAEIGCRCFGFLLSCAETGAAMDAAAPYEVLARLMQVKYSKGLVSETIYLAGVKELTYPTGAPTSPEEPP